VAQRWRVTAQRLRIDAAAGGLTLDDHAIEIETSGMAPLPVVAPDGGHMAYLRIRDAATVTFDVMEIDLASGATIVRASAMRLPALPILGYASAAQLVVGDASSGASWLIDRERLPAPAAAAASTAEATPAEAAEPAEAAPLPIMAGVRQAQAIAVAGGRRLCAFGTWLHVLDLPGGPPRYLGYATFSASSVDLSPDGSVVIWGNTRGRNIAGPVDGSDAQALDVEPEAGQPTAHVDYIDPAHAIVTTAGGKLQLIEVATGKRLADVASSGNGTTVRVARAGAGRPAIAAIQLPGGEIRVYEVSAARGFVGPWPVNDGATSLGLLAAATDDAPLLWTASPQRILRRYSLAELRAGVSTEQLQGRGERLPGSSGHNLVAIDRHGTSYFAVSEPRLSIEVWRDGVRTAVLDTGGTWPSIIVPSPDGRLLAVSMAGVTVQLFDLSTSERRWVRTDSIVGGLAWSDDGALLGIAGAGAALVVDSATGEVRRLDCTPRFEVRSEPPGSRGAVVLADACTR
jgi:hypothetical protein